MTILPLAYLPSVEYFAHLLRGDCVVDLGEHFVKRSERNRARILAANGVMDLTVQVCNANRPRTPMHAVRIDYSKRWQHQHWGALAASYKGSPYFDYYAEHFEPFYTRAHEFLAGYNLALLEMLCAQLRVPMPRVSETYLTAAPGDEDLRLKPRLVQRASCDPFSELFTPTTSRSGDSFSQPLAADHARVQQKSPAFHAEPYVQVFADRMPFAANLSVVDLLFAEGPSSVCVLRRCLP